MSQSYEKARWYSYYYMKFFQLNFKCIAGFCWLYLAASGLLNGQTIFGTSSGTIHFSSDAPLELVEAVSNQMRGIINPSENTFAFSVKILSFEGFNSPLQQEHFNENYLESTDFPEALFSGRIIERIDFSKPGRTQLRAKGMLEIHGIRQERIIKSEVEVSEDGLYLTAIFTVLLADHRINIPRIVEQKIAEEITVRIEANLKKSDSQR